LAGPRGIRGIRGKYRRRSEQQKKKLKNEIQTQDLRRAFTTYSWAIFDSCAPFGVRKLAENQPAPFPATRFGSCNGLSF